MLINMLWSQYNMLLSHYRVIVNTLGLTPHSNRGIFRSSLSPEVRASINGIVETICTRLELEASSRTIILSPEEIESGQQPPASSASKDNPLTGSKYSWLMLFN